MTPRRNQEHWQKLRKDKQSALVVLLVIAAALAAILAAIGVLLGSSRNTDRANPVYWALILPFAWWAASLANYTPWAVNSLRPAALVATLIALASLAAALATQSDVTPWIIAASVAAPCAIAGAYLYPRTLLARPQN